MLLKSETLEARDVWAIVDRVSHAMYADNIGCNTCYDGLTRDKRVKTRWTLYAVSSFGAGARTSASGRHLPKASWQAHRDIMLALFDADPGAELQTALTTYKGRDDFLARFEATGDKNVGSRMEPVALRDTAI